MSLTILGIGTALPRRSMAQADAVELAKAICCQTESQVRLLPALYRRTHVQRRSSVLLEGSNGGVMGQSFFPPAEGAADRGPTTGQRMQRYAKDAAPLALAAAQRALGESHVEGPQITHLITVSCTGFAAPGVDIALIKKLSLPPTVGRTHVGFMGCHGALNGLRVASALVNADPNARVLLCAIELCSLHFHYRWDPDKIVANALFADGAAALVAVSAAARPSPEAWQVVATGSCLFPDSEDAITWQIGDHGFEMTLSARVPALIATHLQPWIEGWLEEHSLTLAQIPSWAVHPGGPRLLDTVSACLGLSGDATATSREVLAECGNMSSPTVLFILERLRQRKAPRPCVALAFGPGLVAEAALFS
ncbi:MAG: type III polyketide synthase [Elusimicrobia bacterium]|nr:type III polyketide synthase [Elusimicrobiota bacterium]